MTLTAAHGDRQHYPEPVPESSVLPASLAACWKSSQKGRCHHRQKNELVHLNPPWILIRLLPLVT